MLLKMTPYNEIGPNNISETPGVHIQVSYYKNLKLLTWAGEEYRFPILYKGENIGRMEMYLCLSLHTNHNDTEFCSSLYKS